MNSEQIRDKSHLDLSSNAWLREIAFQLALLNEKPSAQPPVTRNPKATK